MCLPATGLTQDRGGQGEEGFSSCVVGAWGSGFCLEVQEEHSGVLYRCLDFAEEGHGLSAVYQPVVIGQRHIHHGPNLHLQGREEQVCLEQGRGNQTGRNQESSTQSLLLDSPSTFKDQVISISSESGPNSGPEQ